MPYRGVAGCFYYAVFLRMRALVGRIVQPSILSLTLYVNTLTRLLYGTGGIFKLASI